MTRQEELEALYDMRDTLLSYIEDESLCDNYLDSYHDVCDRIFELETNGGTKSGYKGTAKKRVNK